MNPTIWILKINIPPIPDDYYILYALENYSQDWKGYIRVFKFEDDNSIWQGEEYPEDSVEILNRLSSCVRNKDVWYEYVLKKDPNRLLSKYFPNDKREMDSSKWKQTEHQFFTEEEKERIKEAVKGMQLPQPIVDEITEMLIY